MDPDLPIPSIEGNDVSTMSSDTSQKDPSYSRSRLSDRLPLDTPNSAAPIVLPPSSPLASRQKTPKQDRYSTLDQIRHVSPSLNRAHSSGANDQPASPRLLTKRSTSNMGVGRGVTPSKQPLLRRTSSNLNPTSPSAPTKPLAPMEPISAPTAASVAREYFERELRHHETASHTKTAIFVHDSCYGHRFSRPRTSKAALSTIVERPERVLATILGLSAAYVRLGDRHAGGRYGPHPERDVSSCSPPPFKIRKTSRSIPLSHPAVTHVHGTKWMEELQIMCDSAEGKLALNGKELVRPIGYGRDENGSALPKLHEGDLYLCSESLNALQGCLGGVCDAADVVFTTNTKRAFVCIRPPGHHCSSNFPSGFCWLNNVHVGIAYAAMTHGISHAAIIDFDLHHGDGSQAIAWDHNRRAQNATKHAAPHTKTPIGYFSLHDINSYPCEWGDEEKVRNASLCIDNAHGQSIWNVHLEPWKTHDDFWRLYETKYKALLEKTRIFLRHHTARLASQYAGPKPKAAIFLSAGFDASEWEGEGMQRHKVNVPTDFYAKFTADVVRLSEEEDLGVDGRVISVLEGGYSDRALTSGVLSHVCGLSIDTRQPANNVDTGLPNTSAEGSPGYLAAWWTKEHLEVLEARVYHQDASPSIKQKDKDPGNYTSPTIASSTKMTDQARVRRSLSAQFERQMDLNATPEISYPDVDWVTAAYELSRVIIPSDRQTLSCRHDQLNAEASRARKERQSTVGITHTLEEPMQLRERKSKPAPFETVPVRPPSRGDRRRTTIAAVADLPDPGMRSVNGEATSAAARPRRRSSGASSIVSGFQNMRIEESVPSGGAGYSGQNSRASSVNPAKVPKPAMVKKPKVATNPKPPSKARASPKKGAAGAPPVPRVPSAFTGPPAAETSGEDMVTDQRPSSQARSGSASSVVKAEDVSGGSASTSKVSIKLKVKSPEGEAVARDPDQEGKAKKAKVQRKPAIPKAPRVTKPIENKPSFNDNPLPLKTATEIANPVSTDDAEVTSSLLPSEPPADVTMTSSDQFPIRTGVGAGPAERESSGAPENLPYSSADALTATTPAEHSQARVHGPAPFAIHKTSAPSDVTDTTEDDPDTRFPNSMAPPHYTGTAALVNDTTELPQTQLKPHINPVEPQGNIAQDAFASAPVTSKKSKADLPIFTSSSPIPFANSGDGPGQLVEGLGIRQADRGINVGSGRNYEKSEKSDVLSIWDIPETPLK